jgi:GT2 family glycosyltransferase
MRAHASRAARVTAAITTKNRKHELRKALESLLQQSVPLEILVVDDGSSDGTEAMIASEFPSVRLLRFEQSEGYIVQRNRAAAESRTEFVLSIDDDCVLPATDTVERALRVFGDASVAAVAIPHINLKYSPEVVGQPPSDDKAYATFSFRGCAYAVRREVFLGLGGYRESLIHQGEEEDFCIRLLDSGYVVQLAAAPPIHHLESPRRDLTRMATFGGRNLILFAWFNVPRWYLPFHLTATTINALVWGARHRWFRTRWSGVVAGYRDALRSSERRPVRPSTYRIFRRLKKRGPLPVTTVLGLLNSA